MGCCFSLYTTPTSTPVAAVPSSLDCVSPHSSTPAHSPPRCTPLRASLYTCTDSDRCARMPPPSSELGVTVQRTCAASAPAASIGDARPCPDCTLDDSGAMSLREGGGGRRDAMADADLRMPAATLRDGRRAALRSECSEPFDSTDALSLSGSSAEAGVVRVRADSWRWCSRMTALRRCLNCSCVRPKPRMTTVIMTAMSICCR